jgi:hypothetical protein
MNEAEFIVRRILKEAESWSLAEYEEKTKSVGTALYYQNQRMAQILLINYLTKQFTEEK